MGKLVDEGEYRFGDIIFGSQSVDSTLYLGLYTDTSEPLETHGLADITEPDASGNGYSRISLSRGSWTVTNDVSEYAEQTFTASGADWGNVYGYFIATSSDNTGKLLFVENFSDGPYTVTDADNVKITPKVTIS